MASEDLMRHMFDNKAITDGLGLWCRIVDGQVLDRMPEVFSGDVEWDYGMGTFEHGLDRVVARIKAHLVEQDQCGATQHHLANLRIDLDGDAAESEAYFFAAHAGIGRYAGQTLLQWGNYRDHWRRTADGWRIVKREYRIDISDGPLEIVYGNDTADMWQDGDERRIER
jgi:hypothetical protein